jgi:hypothetical protein
MMNMPLGPGENLARHRNWLRMVRVPLAFRRRTPICGSRSARPSLTGPGEQQLRGRFVVARRGRLHQHVFNGFNVSSAF